jgi:hypothetical protein
MLVRGQLRGLPFRILPRRRGDLVRKAASRNRGLRLVLARERELIGFLARDAVLPGQHLRGLAHHELRQRVEKAVAIHRVHKLEVAHLVAPARILAVHQVRHPAHGLHAAGDDHTRLPELNRLRAKRYRLQS